jgi:REP element-mobilizing transposase RayT
MGSSYHQLYFHIVWATYKRSHWIDSGIEKDLMKLIRERLVSATSELLAFGCTQDHVHLLVKLHPSTNVSVLIGEIKGYTSYIINNQIRPDLGFRWQGGYGAFSISSWDIPRLIKYIENQKEHHQEKSLVQEWELPHKRTRP